MTGQPNWDSNLAPPSQWIISNGDVTTLFLSLNTKESNSNTANTTNGIWDSELIQPSVELIHKGEHLKFSEFADLGLVGHTMQHVLDGSMDRCVVDHAVQTTFKD